MHDEAEGIMKGELAHSIFYYVREKKYFTLDDLNRQLDIYLFPGSDGAGQSKPVAYFSDGFMTGDVGTRVAEKKAKNAKSTEVQEQAKWVPKPGAHIHMTAGQTLTFALHSAQIFHTATWNSKVQSGSVRKKFSSSHEICTRTR